MERKILGPSEGNGNQEAAIWESQNPRDQSWMPYRLEDAATLETAYKAGGSSVTLTIGGNTFVVDVRNMQQANSKGATRPVRRIGPVPPAGPPTHNSSSHVPPPLPTLSGFSGFGAAHQTQSQSHVPSALPALSGFHAHGGAPISALGMPTGVSHQVQTTQVHYTQTSSTGAPTQFHYTQTSSTINPTQIHTQTSSSGHPPQSSALGNPPANLMITPQELVNPLAHWATTPCRYHSKPGGCSNGSLCPFVHDGSASTSSAFTSQTSFDTSSLPPSMVPCKYWSSPGGCHWGKLCIYNHDDPKGHANSKAPENTPCKFFKQGFCNRGSACPYIHDGPAPLMPMPSAPGTPHVPNGTYGTGRCRSLFIGILYKGTSAELKGCVNDVRTMIKTLQQFPGFNITDRRILVDVPSIPEGKYADPTKRNILESLKWLVEGAKPGDTLFLHYSGHGVRVPDTSGDEADGFDEALVPLDHKTSYVILDDDIFDICCRDLPKGVRLTGVMDCCHSGSLMDLMWEYDTTARAFRKATKKSSAAEVVLFSGCKDTQTSADVSHTAGFKHGMADPAKAGGAATNAMAEVLWGMMNKGRGNITWHGLLNEMQSILQRKRYKQIPQLSCSHDANLELKQFSITGPI